MDNGKDSEKLLIDGQEVYLGMYWRPIETAPEDKDVMIYNIDGSIHIARKIACDPASVLSSICWFSESRYDDLIPTHWIPLPEGPDETP